jgi:type I restriction enzyme S subunit
MENNKINNQSNQLPDGWEIKKLGDVADVISGYAFKTIDFKSSGVPVVKIKNIVPPYITLDEVQFVDVENLETKSKYRLFYNDILVSLTGSNVNQFASAVGKIGRVKIKNSSLLLNQRVGKFVAKDKNLLVYDYLYYFINQEEVRYYLAKNAGGAANQANISPNDIKNLVINLPPLDEQKEIAAVLSSLDDKIELNQQINKKLEEMAQAIFRQWFIDFNFPDENGNPYRDSGGAMIDSELGKIPSGWSVGKLGEYVTIKRGGSPRPIQEYLSDCGLRWLKISDATATVAPFIFDIKEFIKESGLSKTVLLQKGSLVLSNSATPGIPKILEVDSCIHDGWLYFQNSKFSNEFLYLLFKDIRVKLVQQGNGSVFTNLKTDIVKNHLMAIPDNIVLNKFNKLAIIVFLQMKSNCQQINNLTRVRDTLLPKLMSGELRL